MKTGIEYGQVAWNPVTGCTKISAACQNCWAERMAKRMAGRCGYDKDEPFKVTLHPDRLDQPLKWKKPRTVLVSFMGDLFHEDVPTTFIDQVLEIIASCPQHTFIALTKRPENLEHKIYGTTTDNPFRQLGGGDYLANLWLGVTAENQARADERIPILLQTPAAKRFVSCEPLLSAIDLTKWLGGKNINDGCRKTILCPNGDRGIQYFTNRRDLETQRTDRECQRCESEVERNPDEKSRNNAKPGPFKSSNDRERQESYGLCSSCSVDVFQQVRNPGCFRDKPQGWESEEQSPKQLRISDQERKYPTCGSGFKAFGQERTTRGEEPECKTHSSTSARNTGDMGKTRNVSIANCRALQSIGDHNTGYLPSENMETSSRGINWCIVGGESGPGARPMHPDWVRSLRDQCITADVPFWFKQWGEWSPTPAKDVPVRGCLDGGRFHSGSNPSVGLAMYRVGKKAAGHLLDGQEWQQMPERVVGHELQDSRH